MPYSLATKWRLQVRCNAHVKVTNLYHTPTNAKTGEPINWFKLPVVNRRFPKFAKAFGWLPSPRHYTAPEPAQAAALDLLVEVQEEVRGYLAAKAQREEKRRWQTAAAIASPG
jgi:hypothetical protein